MALETYGLMGDPPGEEERKRRLLAQALMAQDATAVRSRGTAAPSYVPKWLETTTLPKELEPTFAQWVAQNGITDLDDPQSHYDYRGAFLAGINGETHPLDGLPHYPDTYKQHGHPTFSVESKYSRGPNDGGTWEGEYFRPAGQRPMGAPQPTPQDATRYVPNGRPTRPLNDLGKALMGLATFRTDPGSPEDANLPRSPIPALNRVLGAVEGRIPGADKVSELEEALMGALDTSPGLAMAGPLRAARNVKKGAIQSIREMTPEEAMASARKGAHLKQTATGQYVGAPPGVDSPGKLGAMRRGFDLLVDEGAPGGNWYDRARAGIVEVAGPDPVKQSALADLLALTSAQATPDQNLGAALQGLAGHAVGEPRAIVRTGTQARKLDAAMEAGLFEKPGVRLVTPKQQKTFEYSNKLDPTVEFSHIPVNDIWQGRAFGFPNEKAGFGQAQHAFLDSETTLAADRANKRMAGGRQDWNAASVQAAPWVRAKGESLHKRFPKRYPTLQAGIDEAAKSYPESYGKYTAFGTHEAMPGAGTGMGFPGGTPQEVIDAFNADPRSWWQTGDAADILYRATNGPTRKTNEATGYFMPEGKTVAETNPAQVARPLIALGKDAGGTTIAPESQRILNATEAWRAYLGGQDMGAWSKMIPEGAKSSVSRSVLLGSEGPLTEAQMRALAPVAEKHGFVPVDYGEGVGLLNLRDIGGNAGPETGAELQKLMSGGLHDELRDAVPELAQGRRSRLVSGSYDTDIKAATAGTGEATRKIADLLESEPAILDRLDTPELRQKALDLMGRNDDFAALGFRSREDMQNALWIVGNHGPRALFARAREGAIPLPAVAALLGAGLAGSALAASNQPPRS